MKRQHFMDLEHLLHLPNFSLFFNLVVETCPNDNENILFFIFSPEIHQKLDIVF